MSLINVTDASFKQEVLESDQVVLVDFWAEWCGPCRLLTPVLEALAHEKKASLKIAKVNIDENPETPSQMGVRSIPTLCLFKNGQLLSTHVGPLPKTELINWIEKNS